MKDANDFLKDCKLLSILNVTKEYTQNSSKPMVAVKEVSFKLKEGEFVSIVGPSGCGKTTLLMCIAGLMETTGGHILLNGKKVNCPPKEMVLIFQNYTNPLFPWRTVFGNVLFALENQDISRTKKTKSPKKHCKVLAWLTLPSTILGTFRRNAAACRHGKGSGLRIGYYIDGRTLRLGRCPDTCGP
jgi:ABC-type sugar transport system ATPase subunit